MLLQVVSVMVAPFGTTRVASAVANCSDGPWAVARLPPARAEEPHRIMVMKRAACRIAHPRRDVFGLHRIGAGDSCAGLSNCRGTSAGFDVGALGWDWRSDSVRELEVGAAMLRAGREDAVTPMRHQKEPPQGESVVHCAPARAEQWRMPR